MKDIIAANTDVAALLALGALAGSVHPNPHKDGRAFVILTDKDGGLKVEYLDRPTFPERRNGTVHAADTDSFIAAVTRHVSKESTVLYASLHPAAFVAVLNDHGKKQAGNESGSHWRDHRVSFALGYSKEYDLWLNRQKQPMAQEDFAFFIEDNLPDFKNPEGARMLEIALNFRVKNNLAFKSALKLQDGSVDLQYTEQVEGGAGRAGNAKVPETFTIEIPVWSGLEARKYVFEARLRYRVQGGALSIRYELARPQKIVETAFKHVLEKIRDGVKDVPVIFGKPE